MIFTIKTIFLASIFQVHRVAQKFINILCAITENGWKNIRYLVIFFSVAVVCFRALWNGHSIKRQYTEKFQKNEIYSCSVLWNL